jgi:hypothetical protein
MYEYTLAEVIISLFYGDINLCSSRRVEWPKYFATNRKWETFVISAWLAKDDVKTLR